ncbi:MAG: FimB/Mfa2 family fimbrial subunit [Odoribacteraceae bacterium]|nr:FimB/Mfa2 family fimbrial subunit [Odoribacteraceae bacterium]
MAFGSCKKEAAGDRGETGTLEAKIIFGGTASRATSKAIPLTSWKSIKQIQMFLYDQAGKIKFSDTILPPQTGIIQRTWSMVPAGTYTLAIVANAKSSTDNVHTMIGTSALAWTGMNVRNQTIADLDIQHKASAFPTAISGMFSSTQLKPFQEPSEVFMAYATGVTITSGTTTDITANPLQLKREVSLMRVRLRVNDKGQLFDNSDIDFTHAQTSLLIYTLPADMNISEGNAGGVSTTSDDKAVLVAADGATTFRTGDPTTATHNPIGIVDADYTHWKEVVVFPNNGGRAVTTPNVNAPTTQRYYVVITAHAPKDHLLSDGSKVTDAGGTLIHWAGLVEGAFSPNTIREVNLNLSSGGATGVPTEPAKEGGLTIKINDPLPWSSNIESTSLDI